MTATAKELRQLKVMEILREHGKAGVTELRDRLGVTEMTVRRDLELLEADGVLTRYHGGATLTAGSSYEPPFASRERTHAGAKQGIAHEVASRISDGDTVVLDGGSTGLAVARALATRSVTICPLSLRAAWQLSASPAVLLLLPGGTVRQGERTLVGADTNEFLQSHHFDHYVLTASGMSVSGGLTEWNVEDAAVKRTATRVAANLIAAVDASKFDQVGFVRVCSIDAPDVIVTDSTLPEQDARSLAAAARHVVTVSVDQGADQGADRYADGSG